MQIFVDCAKLALMEIAKAYLIGEAARILRRQIRRLVPFFVKKAKQLRGKQPLQLLIQRKKQPLQQLKILARTVFSLMRRLLDYFLK